jgi:hypothetical protein
MPDSMALKNRVRASKAILDIELPNLRGNDKRHKGGD